MYRNNYTQRGFADTNLVLVFGIVFLILAGMAIQSVATSNTETVEQATKQEVVVTTPPVATATTETYTASDIVVVAGGSCLMVLVVGAGLIWFAINVIADTPARQSPKPKKTKQPIKKVSSFGGTERVIK